MKVLLFVVFVAASPLAACLWDYDTLAQESAGMPDVKVVIVGGFARNPALYYETRLERVTRLLAENPDDLDAYDAAGVACDRLGRSDEAIEWMARKLAAMNRLGYNEESQPNHRYRYLANLGTFHAHRWFSAGANRDDMADLERARDLVADAIAENPDAHFGREKYQLRFIEWGISGPKYFAEKTEADAAGQPSGWTPNVLNLGREENVRISTRDNTHLQELGLEDAIEGICGLITMGAAWESIDAFYVLALLLQIDGKSAFAYFAMLRVQELLAEGRHSIVADLPPEEFDPENLIWLGYSPTKDQPAARSEFAAVRTESTHWQEQRTAYMVERLSAGKHPDTDADFWSDFEGDPNQMEVPAGTVYEAGGFLRATFTSPWFWMLAILFGGIPLVILYYFYAKRKDRKRRALQYAR